MIIHNIRQAKAQLSKLIKQVELGEEVIIARAGKPVARLVPFQQHAVRTRQGGQWRGQVRIADDFDELPESIADAFEMTR